MLLLSANQDPPHCHHGAACPGDSPGIHENRPLIEYPRPRILYAPRVAAVSPQGRPAHEKIFDGFQQFFEYRNGQSVVQTVASKGELAVDAKTPRKQLSGRERPQGAAPPGGRLPAMRITIPPLATKTQVWQTADRLSAAPVL